MPTSPDPRIDSHSKATTVSSGASRLGQDLRQGRNLDLYIAVTVAVVTAALGVLGVVDSSILAASTLAVLAVMAISGLATRHEVDGVRTALNRIAASETGEVAAERFLSSHPPAVDTEIATATDIAIVGITLTRTVRDMLPVLDRRLRAGARVRVVLIDTDSGANAEAVARSKKADTPEFYRNRVSATLDLLRVLASSGSSESALQIRLLPFVPTFGLLLVDADDVHGRIRVAMYQHRTLEPNPTFGLRADRDAWWYGLFKGQFETMWESAREREPGTGGHAARGGSN
ncbi:hypothetical protein I0C86_23795 [Plantactinospora sp. S1510]|uniref:Uncharacterized protein n=1 Tax=Plantactinospora alkalitolerans TaxID=2789879 RepID=A0ABS0H1B9_9ACTN|nr:hypothetical protein [Plantactinospora alkalitolerans]MBF9131964.1 hypothetical protein [Plantactinospora alkalitolerans]